MYYYEAVAGRYVRDVCTNGWSGTQQLEEVSSAPAARSVGRAMVLRNATISTSMTGRS